MVATGAAAQPRTLQRAHSWQVENACEEEEEDTAEEEEWGEQGTKEEAMLEGEQSEQLSGDQGASEKGIPHLDKRAVSWATLKRDFSLTSEGLGLAADTQSTQKSWIMRETNAIRRICWRITTHWCFQGVCFFLIASNCIFVHFQANALAELARGEEHFIQQFQTLEYFFCSAFMIELVIRCLGCQGRVCYDALLVFDMAVVGASVLEVAVLIPLRLSATTSGFGLSLLTVFRVIRLWRLVRFFSTVHIFRPLHFSLTSIARSLTSFTSTALVVGVAVMFFALLLTALLGPRSGSPTRCSQAAPRERFGTLGCAVFTLLQTLLRGEDWGSEIAQPLLDDPATQVAGGIFIVFVALGHFCLMNVVASIFFEQMFMTAKQTEEHVQESELAIRQVGEGLKAMGGSDDKLTELTEEELKNGLRRRPKLLDGIGCNKQQALAIFRQNEVGGKVVIEQLLLSLIKTKVQSRTSDMLVLEYQQKQAMRGIKGVDKKCADDAARIDGLSKAFSRQLTTIKEQCTLARKRFHRRLRAQEHLRSERGKHRTASQLEGIAVRDSCRRRPLLEWGARSSTRQAEEEPGEAGAASRPSQAPGQGQAAEPGPGPGPGCGPAPAAGSLWGSWLEVLQAQGRPWMRQELAAALLGPC